MSNSTATETMLMANRASETYEQKKLQVDEFKSISERLSQVKDEYAAICRAVNDKNRELKMIQSAISSHEFTLLKMNEKWEKENEEKNRILANRQAEVDASAIEYHNLIKAQKELMSKLESQLSNLEKDKLAYIAENKKWELLAQSALSEASKREADVLSREQILAEEKTQFEAYKATIEPELQQVSAIKNENIILLNKLNAKTSMLEKEEAHIAHLKEKAQIEIEKEREALSREKQLIAQQQENMAKREQELADYALEVKAKDADVMKMRKRYELNEKIKEADKK